MPIKIDCPRCKKPLSVPSKKAGSYANCPRCNGRFWVPAETELNREQRAVQNSSRAAEAEPPSSTRLAVPPPLDRVPSPPPSKPPEPEPVPAGKVARFVAADAAQSRLEVAEDGTLPELRLREGEEKKTEEEKSTSVNPLVLFTALFLSVALSILLVLVDVEPGDSFRERKAHARQLIEENYFANLDRDKPLAPYQLHLREAQRAKARGDVATERRLHRKVLGMLRAERARFGRGLTGSRKRDRDLEEQIAILLRND